MNDAIKLIDQVLPVGAINTSIKYNESQNMFVSSGYTSNAGNSYFQGLRLSDRIFIVIDIGIGYMYTFLNGITIHTAQNNERKVIGSKTYYNQVYNEIKIKEDAKEIVIEELKKESQSKGLKFDENDFIEFVDKLVEDAYKNQIENLKNIQLNKLLSS